MSVPFAVRAAIAGRRWAVTRRTGVHRAIVVALIVLWTSYALAQEQNGQEPDRSSFVSDTAKRMAADPTTYAPAAFLYVSMRLDWNSSQVFFQNGSTEHNSRYTLSGRADDVAISYGAGNRRILGDAIAILPLSLMNNITNNVIERILIERYPDHRKFLRAIGWIERFSFASYMSYRLSAEHFRQWQTNGWYARQFGYE